VASIEKWQTLITRFLCICGVGFTAFEGEELETLKITPRRSPTSKDGACGNETREFGRTQ
jgi:hypothetical protein